MSSLIQYKCPCCGSKIEFNSNSQKLKCPFCNNDFDVDALKNYDSLLNQNTPDDMSWEATAGAQWQAGEEAGMLIYTCDSCGGEIVTDKTTAATVCPFCDNPTIMARQFSGDLKPDYIIPFRLDKRVAKSEFLRHLQGKRLLPKVFKDENHIDEIKGIYVPFWLFDANADSDFVYAATKNRVWTDGNFNYHETNHFAVLRSGEIKFEHIPVDGSKKMPDNLMESLEPYDFSYAVDFNPAYLSGYVADRYDVTAEQSILRANERVRKSVSEAMDMTLENYDTKTVANSSIRLKHGKAKYALYPVWILNTTWNGQKFLFAMNGQSGKFVGDLPLDKKAYMRWFVLLGSALSAAFLVIAAIIWLLLL